MVFCDRRRRTRNRQRIAASNDRPAGRAETLYALSPSVPPLTSGSSLQDQSPRQPCNSKAVAPRISTSEYQEGQCARIGSSSPSRSIFQRYRHASDSDIRSSSSFFAGLRQMPSRRSILSPPFSARDGDRAVDPLTSPARNRQRTKGCGEVYIALRVNAVASASDLSFKDQGHYTSSSMYLAVYGSSDHNILTGTRRCLIFIQPDSVM